MAVYRDLTLNYGSFVCVNPTAGYHVTGVHEQSWGPEAFSVVFDIVVYGAAASTLSMRVATLVAALEKENEALTVSYDSAGVISYTPGPSSFTAGSSRAEFQTLPEFQSKRTRGFRVTISGTTIAKQTGKLGIRSQSFRESRGANGATELEAVLVFTPYGSEDAYERADHSTYGFAKKVSDFIQSSYSGTVGTNWERSGPEVRSFDEDKRFLSVTARYRHLIYAQDGTGDDDESVLRDIEYSVDSRRRAASGTERLRGTPLADVAVGFSSVVDVEQTQDLDAALYVYVMPYIRSTVSRVLRTGGELVEVDNTLRAIPTANAIAGTVSFVVATSNLVSVAVSYSEKGHEGVSLFPIFDESKWNRDKEEGPASLKRSVALAVTERGSATSALAGEIAFLIAEQEGQGFVFMGHSKDWSTTVTQFGGGEGSLTITAGAWVGDFERANVIDVNGQGPEGQGGGVAGGGLGPGAEAGR